MKLYTILHPIIFAGVFLWMLGSYCTQPDESPAPIKITTPALSTDNPNRSEP